VKKLRKGEKKERKNAHRENKGKIACEHKFNLNKPNNDTKMR